MEGMDGKFYEMAGVIPGKVWRTPRLTRFGYITLKQNQGISHGKQETAILGESDLGVSPAHEFIILIRIIVELHFMLQNRKANAGGTACTALIIVSWLSSFILLRKSENPTGIFKKCLEYKELQNDTIINSSSRFYS